MGVIRLILVAAGLLAVVLSAYATVMVHLDLDELSRRSDAVVVGTVTDTHTIFVHGYPWTVATLSVHESLLKSTSGSIRVQIPGGVQVINGRVLVTRVDGAPSLTRLQKAVFFLRGNAPENMQLVGWNQGFWPISNVGGREVATSGDESSAFPQLSLEDLKSRVQKARRQP